MRGGTCECTHASTQGLSVCAQHAIVLPRINPKTHSETSVLKQVFCIHSGMGLRNAVGNRGLRVRPAYLPQYGRYYQSRSDTEYKTVNPPRQRVVIAVFFVLNTRFFNLVIPIAFCIFFCIGVDGITVGRAPAYKLVRSA